MGPYLLCVTPCVFVLLALHNHNNVIVITFMNPRESKAGRGCSDKMSGSLQCM